MVTRKSFQNIFLLSHFTSSHWGLQMDKIQEFPSEGNRVSPVTSPAQAYLFFQRQSKRSLSRRYLRSSYKHGFSARAGSSVSTKKQPFPSSSKSTDLWCQGQCYLSWFKTFSFLRNRITDVIRWLDYFYHQDGRHAGIHPFHLQQLLSQSSRKLNYSV